MAKYKGKFHGVINPANVGLLIMNHNTSEQLTAITYDGSYDVTFQADICLPHPGQRFRGRVELKSKIGLHVDLAPLKVLIPRDLHLGNKLFEETEPEAEVEFEVIGTQFKQGDEEIIVVAKLVGNDVSDVKEVELEIPSFVETPRVTGDEMRVVVKDEAPKKRKLKQKPLE